MVRFLSAVLLIVYAAMAARTDTVAQTKPYDGPVFDAHLHYSQRSWTEVPLEAALHELEQAGVRGVYVSSTPDDGTLKLLEAAPSWLQVIPSFRPYRPGQGGSTNWWKFDDTLSYAKARLALGRHASIGEVHIQRPELFENPVVRDLVVLAAENGWLLHPHAGADVIARIFELHPNVRVVWAHAGFFEEPELVDAMMTRYKTLWADLSYREGDVMDVDGVAEEWERVFLNHPDRFMVGSDTWVSERWKGYQGTIDENRIWLGALPPDVAEKIAWKNAERLFGLAAPAGVE